MEATPVRGRTPAETVSRFGDNVFRSQILLAGSAGFILGITVLLSDRYFAGTATFLVGIVTILWATIGAAVVPWPTISRRWQLVVPLLDIAGLGLLRFAVPESGFGVLMIFPVFWLSISLGRAGALAGPTLAGAMLLSQAVLTEVGAYTPPATMSPISAVSLAVSLVFVSAVTYATARRVESQRILLRRQTRMLEHALRRARVQESTLREAFDAVEFAVIGLDPDGATTTTNRAAHALLTQLGLPVTTPWHLFPLYRADRVTPLPPAELPHVRLLAGERVDGETYLVGHRTGTRFTIELSGRLLHDARGEVDQVVLVLRDVSKEARAIADRDDLVTSMSHELRTPLSSILGYVDLVLESDGLPQETRDMLGIALSNAERLNALVNDLLAARSTSPANAIVLSPARCDVSTLVRESVDAIRPMSAERLIAVQVSVDDGVEAVADGFRLRQVVDNLLSNAIKYNRAGGRIAVTARTVDRRTADGPAGPAVEVRVLDTGRGMTLDEQKGLFERFYRAESVRGSTVHGTGLGLSISREIVVLHGGTIEVDSEPDRGTEMIVTIPRGDLSPSTTSTPITTSIPRTTTAVPAAAPVPAGDSPTEGV